MAKIHKLSKIYIYIFICLQSFSTTLDKAWERIAKKKRERERDGEIGEHKLHEMGALKMKYKK